MVCYIFCQGPAEPATTGAGEIPAARPSFNDSGFKNGQSVMVVWTKIINLCALVIVYYSLGIFSIIIRSTTEYLVIKL